MFGKPFEYAKFSVPEYHFGTNIIHYIFFLEKHLENFGRTLCSLKKVSRPENHLKTWCIWMVLIFGYFIKYFMYLIHIQIGKTLGEHYVPWTRFLDWKTLVNLNVFKGYQNLLNLLNTLCIYVISQVYSQVGNNPLFPVNRDISLQIPGFESTTRLRGIRYFSDLYDIQIKFTFQYPIHMVIDLIDPMELLVSSLSRYSWFVSAVAYPAMIVCTYM